MPVMRTPVPSTTDRRARVERLSIRPPISDDRRSGTVEGCRNSLADQRIPDKPAQPVSSHRCRPTCGLDTTNEKLGESAGTFVRPGRELDPRRKNAGLRDSRGQTMTPRSPRLDALTLSIVVASAAMSAALAIPLLTGTVLPAGDVAGFHIRSGTCTSRHSSRAAPSSGRRPLGNGLDVHGEGQAGMTHPVHLALYRFLSLSTAVNLEMLGSYGFAFAGMWLLMRRLGLTREAALAAAMALPSVASTCSI